MPDQLKFFAPPFLALLVGGTLGFRSAGDTNEILFMNVGQGDCTAVVSRGAVALFDVGPKSGANDAGARIVVPELRKNGLHPSVIVLTHPDTDHVGGLAAVVRAFPEALIFINAEFRSSKHMIDQLQEADVPESRVHWLSPRCEMRVGDFTADLFCPPWRVGENDNEGSVVAKVSHGRASAVLMGDAGIKTEFTLLGRLDWRAEVLKIGHHGSRFSTSEAWLRAVQPKWGVVSCGLNNRYGHPHRATLDRLREAQVNVARTDEEGNVVFAESENGFERVK